MLVQEILFEARQSGPDVSYSVKQVKGKVTAVTAQLEKISLYRRDTYHLHQF